MRQRILFVAAEPREFNGLLRHCRGVSRLSLAVDWARKGVCTGREFWMAANGAGWARAGRCVDAARQAGDLDAVVSTGFCGALDTSLGIGEVFAAEEIMGWGRVCLPATGQPFRRGPMASIDHVAGSLAEKTQLRKSGAWAVEMEAGGVARRASECGVPFYCVRGVTDLGRESFDIDFNAALRSDGYFDTIGILRSAIHRPLVRFPELLRLVRRCAVTANKLGDFLASCRY